MFSSFLDSPKVMGLGLDGLGFWVACLAIGNRAAKRGTLPKLDEIAFIARTSTETAKGLVDRMVERKLLTRNDDGTFGIHDWEEYQAKSDAERQRDKRDRDRLKRDGSDDDTGNHESSRPVTESHDLSRDVPNVTKERRGEEKREDPPTPQTGGVSETDSDSEPFIPPTGEPSKPFGAIGGNSASEVNRAVRECLRLWPDGSVASWVMNWLAKNSASRVVSAMLQTYDKKIGKPSAYIESILSRPESVQANSESNGHAPAPEIRRKKTWVRADDPRIKRSSDWMGLTTDAEREGYLARLRLKDAMWDAENAEIEKEEAARAKS